MPEPKPVSRQMGCPSCSHEHTFLNCDWCDCTAHIQLGIYPDVKAPPNP